MLSVLLQVLVERELRQAMTREGIEELSIYPEQRHCAHPTIEQVLRLFSLAERHHLLQHGRSANAYGDLRKVRLDQVEKLHGGGSGCRQHGRKGAGSKSIGDGLHQGVGKSSRGARDAPCAR